VSLAKGVQVTWGTPRLVGVTCGCPVAGGRQEPSCQRLPGMDGVTGTSPQLRWGPRSQLGRCTPTLVVMGTPTLVAMGTPHLAAVGGWDTQRADPSCSLPGRLCVPQDPAAVTPPAIRSLLPFTGMGKPSVAAAPGRCPGGTFGSALRSERRGPTGKAPPYWGGCPCWDSCSH